MQITLPPLAAETIFYIGSFPVTNSFINATLATLVFSVFAIFLQRSIKKYDKSGGAPRGLYNFFEALLQFLLGYFDQVTGDRKKSLKFLAIVGGLFFFILIANWMGLMPGTGSLFRVGLHHGELARFPLLRPANADLNMTAAMAVTAVIASHLIGIAAIGFFKYANKFIKLGDLWAAVISLNPTKILIAVIEFFVGFIEIFSEIAKMVSLSLRLYGNIFAGEVLLTVLASLIDGYGAFGLPLPFMALELVVGAVQATVFSMLTLVYLNIATQDLHGHNQTPEQQTGQPAAALDH